MWRYIHELYSTHTRARLRVFYIMYNGTVDEYVSKQSLKQTYANVWLCLTVFPSFVSFDLYLYALRVWVCMRINSLCVRVFLSSPLISSSLSLSLTFQCYWCLLFRFWVSRKKVINFLREKVKERKQKIKEEVETTKRNDREKSKNK